MKKLNFRYWWTREEWSRDQDTDAVAMITESVGGWKWQVALKQGPIQRGTSTSQKGARAACRRVVRKLEKEKNAQ